MVRVKIWSCFQCAITVYQEGKLYLIEFVVLKIGKIGSLSKLEIGDEEKETKNPALTEKHYYILHAHIYQILPFTYNGLKILALNMFTFCIYPSLLWRLIWNKRYPWVSFCVFFRLVLQQHPEQPCHDKDWNLWVFPQIFIGFVVCLHCILVLKLKLCHGSLFNF